MEMFGRPRTASMAEEPVSPRSADEQREPLISFAEQMAQGAA